MACMCQCHELEEMRRHFNYDGGSIQINLKNLKRKAGKYSPSMNRQLKKIGDEAVSSITIVRTPLGKFLTDAMNFVSLGAYKEAVKSTGYDSMFHLAMWINGKYSLDKQAVVVLSTKSPIKEKSETFDVSNIPSGLTIRELVDKTKAFMGDEKFSEYDAHTNNCQDFILAVLESNGMLTPDVKAFVKQDVDKIFEKLPEYAEKVAKTFTDIGAVADKVVQGGRFEIRKVKHGKFEVINIDTGKIHAYSTTLRNAKSQVRLLNAIDHGFQPTKNNVSQEKGMNYREFVKQEMKKRGTTPAKEYMKVIAKKWQTYKKK